MKRLLGLAVLIALASAPAAADEAAPVNLPPAVAVAPSPITPAVCPTGPTDDLARKLAAVEAALAEAKAKLGVPDQPLPTAFWQSKTGQALAWTLSAASVAVSAASVGVAIYQAARPVPAASP